jgi:non-specific serine/threonine protein kinase
VYWLEEAVSRGFINYPFLATIDPSLENCRKDPRFSRLMKIVRKRWEEFES